MFPKLLLVHGKSSDIYCSVVVAGFSYVLYLFIWQSSRKECELEGKIWRNDVKR